MQILGIEKAIKSALSKGVLHLFISMVFSQVIAFLLGIVLARFLGPENYGHIRVMNAVLRLALVPAAFGIPSAIAKYVAEFQPEKLKKSVLSQGIMFNFLTASLASFVILLLVQNSIVIKDSVARYYLQFVCWTCPFTVVASNVLCYFQGRKQIKKMAVYRVASQSFRFVIVCGITYLWILKGYIIAGIVSEVIAGFILLSLIRNDIVWSWDNEIFRKMIKLASFAFLGFTFATITLTIDTLCVANILKDPALVGYYGVAVALASGLMFIPGSITQTALPYLSEKSKDLADVSSQVRRMANTVSLIMLPICTLVFLGAPVIISVFFGSRYLPAAKVLQVLMPGIFMYSLHNVIGTTLLAVGRTDLNFYTTLIGGTLNVILNIMLIKKYGMIGAAYATSMTYGVRLVVNFLLFRGVVKRRA